jgi:uncharacterized protein YqhQ
MLNKINVGGQAVIEGVMMRAPSSVSVSVRAPNGEIVNKTIKYNSITQKFKFLSKPFFRGIVVLIESLIIGIKALNFSASIAQSEEKETKSSKFTQVFSIIFAFFLGMIIFVVTPHILTLLLGNLFNISITTRSFSFHIIDGAIKIIFFISYVLIISLLPDIKRIFQYHGAEHKSIYAHEFGEDLTVENIRKYSTLHPRCGTSFIMFVIIISILIFSIIYPFMPHFIFLGKWGEKALLVIIKIPLLFPIASISYEILKLSDKKVKSNVSQNTWFSLLINAMIKPGLLIQKITTAEPTDDQIEVAISSLQNALKMEHIK